MSLVYRFFTRDPLKSHGMDDCSRSALLGVYHQKIFCVVHENCHHSQQYPSTTLLIHHFLTNITKYIP
ncbi:uncharacterized protein BYT42DRAFT_583040 [Radiomyces spectabilis]|uniref:uncharacterized protein n=1 Tax=Radiomyces spectabilis TaxID=64574 RepID=UPI00222041A8|nr:uncharacterized protein BYT42DRAFT_583040 [Radiomyces spectabilis]KAI8370615.1 hypothetical protein BYT42DRAFT_583040 [Radiomyces spectabilis]